MKPGFLCNALATVTILMVAMDSMPTSYARSGDNCGRVCPMAYAPVCGSNNQSYWNACRFHIAKCQIPMLTLASMGKCDGTPSLVSDPSSTTPMPTLMSERKAANCPQMECSPVFEPVCGSDRKTYSSECELSKATCADKTIAMKHTGECGTGCAEATCPKFQQCVLRPFGTVYCIDTCDPGVCQDQPGTVCELHDTDKCDVMSCHRIAKCVLPIHAVNTTAA